MADSPRPVNVPAGDLTVALEILEKQSGVEIVYRPELLKGLRTGGVKGTLSSEEAVTQLLQGTKLTIHTDKTGVLLITEARVIVPTTTPSLPGAVEGSGAHPTTEAGKNASHDFRVAAVEQTSAGAEVADDAKRQPVQLQEVIVTAQKRAERLVDTPQSVAVLSPDDLQSKGVTQLRDWAGSVPGLSFITQGAGRSQLALRGVTTGRDVGPTVGIYVDEVPYGSSSLFGNGNLFTVDVGLFDLDRIEVLRGPQGTLYGASTMGGLVKYVTKAPNTTEFGTDMRTGLSSTEDGGVNYDVSAAVNMPLVAGKVALRLSGFDAHDGGYIDNITLGQDNVNRSDTRGGRIDLLVTPTDALSIRINGFLQNIDRDGEGTSEYAYACKVAASCNYASTPIGAGLNQQRLIGEPFDQRFRLVSGTVNYDFGWANLVSVSSYQTAKSDVLWDLSKIYGALLQKSYGLTFYAVGDQNIPSTRKFTQELRLSSKGPQLLEWVAGMFYTHERSDIYAHLPAYESAYQLAPNDIYTTTAPSRYEEYAPFGDLTWHIIEKLDVTGGIRYSHIDQTRISGFASGLIGGKPNPTVGTSDHVFTYSADVRYHIDDHDMAYLRYATGYRPGGPNYVIKNPLTGQLIGAPFSTADRLRSYEAGFKAESADRRFGLDLSIYHIDWMNMQVQVSQSGFSGIENIPGKAATSDGAEFNVSAHLISGLNLSAALSYMDAKMLQTVRPPLGASDGETLPNTPRFSGTANAEYLLPVGASWQPTVGATVHYVGNRMASFDHNTGYLQEQLPHYTTFDLRAGVKFDRVDAQIYVRNIGNEQGLLSAYNWRGDLQPALIQPRTIGISAAAHF